MIKLFSTAAWRTPWRYGAIPKLPRFARKIRRDCWIRFTPRPCRLFFVSLWCDVTMVTGGDSIHSKTKATQEPRRRNATLERGIEDQDKRSTDEISNYLFG